LKGNDDKVRVVLNKADMETQKLMRVYGALMWSLGKITQTPEVLRVYVGSFWDQKLRFTENQQLIEAEMRDLLADLRSLPRNSAIRKINETIKRARMTKVHVLVINHLRNQFGIFGKESLQKKLLENLLDEFKKVQKEYGLPPGDFPNVQKFRETLAVFKIDKFPKLNKKQIQLLDELTSKDIPHLMELLPTTEHKNDPQAEGTYAANPFKENMDAHLGDGSWVIDGTAKKNYDVEFYKWPLTADGKMTGQVAKQMLLKTGVNTQFLRKIWDLSDMDKDGNLDSDEFAVAMYLVGRLKSGVLANPPEQLEQNEVPPSKRDYSVRVSFGETNAS